MTTRLGKLPLGKGGIYAALDGRYLTMVVGVTWLLGQLDRELTADETAYQTQWAGPLK